MTRRIPAIDRHKAEQDWLKSYHLFSFAMYQDRGNMNFGGLRVFNDDYIDGENGFGAHQHDNMEIVTIVHNGTLTHQDSMGNTGTIKAGEVQYMSAGTGVTHAEVNQEKEPIHLYQIWMFPDEQNLAPQYEQKDFSSMQKNVLVPVASGQKDSVQDLSGAIPIRTNTTIYKATMDPEKSVRYSLGKERGLFVYIKSGSAIINGITFEAEDQARIMDETDVLIKATESTGLVALDVSMRLPF